MAVRTLLFLVILTSVSGVEAKDDGLRLADFANRVSVSCRLVAMDAMRQAMFERSLSDAEFRRRFSRDIAFLRSEVARNEAEGELYGKLVPKQIGESQFGELLKSVSITAIDLDTGAFDVTAAVGEEGREKAEEILPEVVKGYFKVHAKWRRGWRKQEIRGLEIQRKMCLHQLIMAQLEAEKTEDPLDRLLAEQRVDDFQKRADFLFQATLQHDLGWDYVMTIDKDSFKDELKAAQLPMVDPRAAEREKQELDVTRKHYKELLELQKSE